jgi:hypothetical protein
MGSIKINDIEFKVEDIRWSASDQERHLQIGFQKNPSLIVHHDLYSAIPILFLEEIDFVDESGRINGDFFLYVFDHEDFTDHSFSIQNKVLTGEGTATISGKPCTVKIVEPINLA